jgi:hypothetical protein
MTDHPLLHQLSPVRQRQRKLLLMTSMTWGLLGGSLAAIIAATLRLAGQPLSIQTAGWLVLGGLIAGICGGLIKRLGWHDAAAAVDSRYQLKDRTITALEFSQQPDADDIRKLQVSDASEHLQSIDPHEVAPYRMPRLLPYALAATVAGFALFLIPVNNETANASPTAPLDHIVAAADQLDEELVEDLEKVNEEAKDEELDELVKELKEMLKEMKEPGVDERDAIAKMSEMQAAIAALQQEYNSAKMDANLEAVGEAFAPAAALKAAAESLKGQKYDKAADELSKVDFDQLSRKEAKAVTDKLSKLAKDLEKGQPGSELSKCLNGMCEGLKNKNASQCKSNAGKLCKLCKKQGLCKKVGNCLGCQLALLSQCKGQCKSNKSGYCKKVALSDSPSQNWGMGESHKPLGDKKPDLDGNRNRDDITGIAGDGPSEKEISHSPEGRQEAARGYRQVYNEYQKKSEAVLESEAFPLGQRQIIRNYFEAIRPQNAEVDEVFKESAPESETP